MKVTKITGAMIMPMVLVIALGLVQAALASHAQMPSNAAAQGGLVSDFFIDPTALNSASGNINIFFNVTDGYYVFVRLELQDLSGRSVALISPTELRSPGMNVVSWNGKDLFNRPVPEGHYNIVLTATSLTTEVHTVPVVVDNSPPATVATLSGTQSPSGWYASNALVTLSALDTLSGVSATYYKLDDGQWIKYVSPVNIDSDGVHTLFYYSIDNARNTEGTKSVTINVDKQPPVTGIKLDGTKGDNGWFITPPTATLTAVDSASGVKYITYSLNGGPWALYTGHLAIGDGDNTLAYRSVDNVGNVEATKSLNIRADTKPPVTSIRLDGTKGNNGWFTTPPIVTLSAADTASGVGYTEYRMNDGPWTRYAGPMTIGDGENTLAYRSVDHAGNTEAIKSQVIRADTKPPVTCIKVDGVKSVNGWYVTPPTVTLTAQDAGSGVRYIMYSLNGAPWAVYTEPLTIGDYENILVYRSVDMVGHVEQNRTEQINCDLSDPAVLSTTPANGGTNVPTDTVIKATLNEELFPSSVNSSTFIVRYGNTRVPGRIDDCLNNMTVVFTPSAPLGNNKLYTVTITTGVVDPAGIHLPADYTWSFTTARPTISGFAYVDANRNKRYDPGEQPLAGCGIRLENTKTKVRIYTTTDSHGRYEFANLQNGSYMVSVIYTPKGYTATTSASSKISIADSPAGANFGFRAR